MHIKAPKKDALDKSWNLLLLLDDKNATNATNPIQLREVNEIGENIKRNLNWNAAKIGKMKIKPSVINIVQGLIVFFSCN